MLGEVVARFPLELHDDEIEQIARLAGADETIRISPLGLFLIRGKPTLEATQELLDELWETKTAVRLVPNVLSGGLTFVPDDPHHGDQWYQEQASDVDLDMEAAWEITRGSEDVVVAVVDSGLRLDHPEFAGRLFVNPGEIPDNGEDDDDNDYIDDVSGWNTIAEEPSGNVNDQTYGHGTYVAGVLLANGDNAFQVAGMDHLAKLLPIRMTDGVQAAQLQMAALIAGLDYLCRNQDFATVVSMSLAQFFSNQELLDMLNDELDALAEGHVLIAGAGNSAVTSACYGLPNGHPDVITVAATDALDEHASFSSSGPCVDFAAPGVDIALVAFSDPEYLDGDEIHVDDGTSFSTPMIAGVASLGLSIWPAMTQADLYAALQASALDLGSPGKDDLFGWGRVNAFLALDAIQRLFADGFESGDTAAWN